MITRRTMLASLIGLAIAPKVRLEAASNLTITQIIQVIYPTLLAEMKQGRSWIDLELELLQAKHHIILDHMERSQEDIVIPFMWTLDEERLANTEAKRIRFSKYLLMKALWSHDQLLLDRIGNSQALVSKEYRYTLGAIGEFSHIGGYFGRIYTAVEVY